MTSQDQLKREVAQKALTYVPFGQVLGVGTGSTVNFFIEYLADIKKHIPAAVSSSVASTKRLEAIGIPVLDLNEVLAAGKPIPLYVDGADEANDQLELIKGGGAAHTREKIIAQAAKEYICIVDQSKCVPVLGKFPLPVEVIPMARELIAKQLKGLGGNPVWRQAVVTDNGNDILDVHGLSIHQARDMELLINQWPGVVSNGLFALRPADRLLIATPNGVAEKVRAN